MKSNLAEKIDTPLSAEILTFPSMKQPVDPSSLDFILQDKPVRQHIREFGAVVSLVLLALALYGFYSGSTTKTPYILTTVAVALSAICYLVPALGKPLWKGWMWLGKRLEVVMTFTILGLLWSLMFVPIGMILKAFGKKTVETGFKLQTDSYWEVVDPERDNFKLLERQF